MQQIYVLYLKIENFDDWVDLSYSTKLKAEKDKLYYLHNGIGGHKVTGAFVHNRLLF